jgi:hypothetical protein
MFYKLNYGSYKRVRLYPTPLSIIYVWSDFIGSSLTLSINTFPHKAAMKSGLLRPNCTHLSSHRGRERSQLAIHTTNLEIALEVVGSHSIFKLLVDMGWAYEKL